MSTPLLDAFVEFAPVPRIVRTAAYTVLTSLRPAYRGAPRASRSPGGNAAATAYFAAMLVNAVIYTIPSDKADEAHGYLRELAAASRTEPGCLGYEVARADEPDRATFVLFEKYRDEADLDAHMATEHFQRLGLNGFRPLATGRQQIKGTLIE
jgi:quinol monooxygenase YgiN